jgi:uncharacterized membrane protein
MSSTEDFLSSLEEQEIIETIQKAENYTSGEIRVHLESELYKDAHERALEVFHLLEMNKTKLKNGVLFYVAVQSKSFVIYGDQGVHKRVPIDFWDNTKDTVLYHFKKQQFKKGLIAGILAAGEQLQHYFPINDDDINELSNEISRK